MPLPASRWLALGLLLMSLGLVANALIGPLVLDVVDYPFSETIRNQAIGLEIVSLALVAPWGVLAAALTWRQHSLGPILAVVPGGYTAYMMLQYVIGPNYLVYAHVVPLHLGLFILGGLTALVGWSLSPSSAVARPAHPRRYALLVLAIALFVVSRYLGGILGSFTEQPLAEEFADDPAMFWTIFFLDLGIVVPAACATAIALFRASRASSKALYALLGWFTLVPISVASMAITMLVNDDPHKSLASTLVFGAAAILFTAFAAWVHVRLTAGASRRSGGGAP